MKENILNKLKEQKFTYRWILLIGTCVLSLFSILGFIVGPELIAWRESSPEVIINKSEWSYIPERSAAKFCHNQEIITCLKMNDNFKFWQGKLGVNDLVDDEKSGTIDKKIYFGIYLSSERMKKIRDTMAFNLILGATKGSLKVWVDGQLFYQTEREDFYQANFNFPLNSFENESAFLLLELVPIQKSTWIFSILEDSKVGFYQMNKASSHLRMVYYVRQMRGPIFSLLFFICSMFFVSFAWVEKKRTYLYAFGLYFSTLALWELIFSRWFGMYAGTEWSGRFYELVEGSGPFIGPKPHL